MKTQKTQIEIEVTESGVSVTGPYSESNNTVYRSLGGKFAGGHWTLPDNQTTRETLAELFGTKSEIVEVLVPRDATTGGKIAQIGGYVLASRRGRDYRVEMPDGVSLAAGHFRSSGGSVKNPSVSLDSDVVFRLSCRWSFAESHGLEIAEQSAPIDI
jgi:antitoxin component HigA of HigAB toxin-antitoxin module